MNKLLNLFLTLTLFCICCLHTDENMTMTILDDYSLKTVMMNHYMYDDAVHYQCTDENVVWVVHMMWIQLLVNLSNQQTCLDGTEFHSKSGKYVPAQTESTVLLLRPITVAKYCNGYICLSHKSETTGPNFAKFLVHVARGHGSVLLTALWYIMYFRFYGWRHCHAIKQDVYEKFPMWQ